MLLSNCFRYDSTSPHKAKAYLIRRISGAIIRQRQNAEGARLKHPPQFFSISDEGAPILFDNNDPAKIAEEKAARCEEQRIFQKAFSLLSPLQQKAVKLRLNGAPPREISKALNVRYDYSGDAIRRLKKRVKELLNNPLNPNGKKKL